VCEKTLGRWIGLLSLVLLAAAPGPLERGEVVARLERLKTARPDAPQAGWAQAVVDFPPERVFRAITDFAHYEEFMPYVESSDARPQPDGSVLSTQEIDLPAPLQRRRYTLRARWRVAPGRWTVTWRYVPGSGDVRDLQGSWELVPFGPPGRPRTLVTLRQWSDFGSVPDFLADRATRASLPWILEGLRQQVRRSRYDS
jgi:ribosome-associated toxin RatA of RatAB toxin-antitoxin module